MQRVSVIIPTKNRPLDLDLTLRSIVRQSFLPFQVIIVDQSPSGESHDRVKTLFQEMAQEIQRRIQLLYLHDPHISGGAAARNRAIGIARGDIWLFLDDDVILESDFLKELLRVYEEHPLVSGVSGIITNYEQPSILYRIWASMFGRGPFHDERQPIYHQADRLRGTRPIRVTKFTGALMSFRAEVVHRHSFDENLSGVCDGEDVDFCLRLGPRAHLVIAPRARLAHNKSSIGRAKDHWLRRFARENHYQYHRNWSREPGNRLAFLWFNIGCGVQAAISSLRRASLVPWRALIEGAREGRFAAGKTIGEMTLGVSSLSERHIATENKERYCESLFR